jgi:CBS domain containing-hemolysin-like protein
MPDSDAPSRPAEPARRSTPTFRCRCRRRRRERRFLRALARALFGWKNGPTRADIEVVLEAAGPGEAGVSPEERTMIRNILALRGRRIEDVMVPRGDIIAVQQDIRSANW